MGIYTYVFNLNYLLFITCTDKVLRDNNNIFTAIGFLPGGSGYFICKQNMRLVTTRFKSGGLHEKHVVATWNLGNHLGIYNHFSIYPVHYIHIFNSQVRDFLIITRRKFVTYFRRNMRPPSSW